MKTINTLLLAIFFILSCSTFAIAEDVVDDSSLVDTLVKANNEFAISLYKKLSQLDENLFFSPYSVSSALGMTCAGAKENTAKEIRNALRFKLSRKLTHSTFKKLNHLLVSNAQKSDQILSIANALCLVSGEIRDKYKVFIQKYYDAEIFNGDLASINAWVKKKTESKIETILSQLASDTVCVILNAIYFKGNWDSEFDKTDTRDKPFNVTSVKKTNVPMMYQRKGFKLLEKENFKAVSIPYKGNHMSMMIILPNKMDEFDDLEKQLSSEKISVWSSELNKRPVQTIDLSIPKFKLGADYSLTLPCQSLGIKDAFTPGIADFRNMGWPVGKLWISKIVHKAFVEVNEKGTEAAAVTAVMMQTESVHIYPSFKADHPFIFIIKDNPTGSILFMGKIIDPSAT